MADQHPEFEDILATIRRFLSDEIPPLNATEAVLAVAQGHPEPVALEIRQWIVSQTGRAGSPGVSDLIFHALKKLNETAELKLVPAELMCGFLRQLKPLVVEFAPPDEREELSSLLDELERAPTALGHAIGFVHRPIQTAREGGAASAPGLQRTTDVEPGRTPHEQRIASLLGRIQKPCSGAAPKSQLKQASGVVALAASEARDRSEIAQIQVALSQAGAASGTSELFKLLGESLPGWVMPSAGEGTPPVGPSQNMALLAMRQLLRLAQSRNEGWQRFQEMVQAGIEQFNQGSLARAVTILEMSESVLADGTVDARAAESARSSAHESLDSNRLRRYAEQPEKHHLLRRMLAFFNEFAPDALLSQLQLEPKRDRRRLILNLLEAEGAPARAAAFARLRETAQNPDTAPQWYFTRNLLCVLSRITPPEETGNQEVELVSGFLDLAYPAPLVREAISLLGQAKHDRAELSLLSTLDRIERTLLDRTVGAQEAGKLKSLLDRIVSVLARSTSSRAISAVVNHGMQRHAELGDTLARLGSLSLHDLSSKPEIVGRLLQAMRVRAPRKVLGVTIQKDAQGLTHIVRALSSTPVAAVQEAFQQMAQRFPEQEFGKAASHALQAFHSGQQGAESAPADRLFGDLELFGLPELLHQLVRSRVSGTLTIKDQAAENVAGILTLSGGRLHECRTGALSGKTALYQLLAQPFAGAFSFVGHKTEKGAPDSAAADGEDLMPLIIEGMRRHDEVQRARTLVPDGVRLGTTGSDPLPRPDEEDPVLFQRVWKCVAAGARPEDCERDSKGDPTHVRLLLARWLEDGNLAIG